MILRPTRDEYFMSILRAVADRSTCARRKVGAIITTEDGRILATGYNGPPRGFPHCIETPCAGRNDPPGDSRRCVAVHAEVNALLQCWRVDLAHTIYVSCTPCFSCAKMLANTSIKRVVCSEPYADFEGASLLAALGIKIVIA